MLRKVFLTLLAIAMIATPGYAEGVEVHGFSFSTSSISWEDEGVVRNFNKGHTWLITSKTMENFEVFGILTPIGPPKYVHNLQLSWKNPIKGLSTVTVGRTQPQFGDEWTKRIDRLPTINYSGINAPLVARDVGVTIMGHIPPRLESEYATKNLNWTVGVFAGQRTGGNVPISERGKMDGYGRLILNLPLGIKVGTSTRFGPFPAIGGDFSWQFKNLSINGEIINSKKVSESVTAYHYLAEYAVTKDILAVLRYEHLAKGERVFTSGLSFKQVGNQEVKINFIASKQEADVFLSQLVLRW